VKRAHCEFQRGTRAGNNARRMQFSTVCLLLVCLSSFGGLAYGSHAASSDVAAATKGDVASGQQSRPSCTACGRVRVLTSCAFSALVLLLYSLWPCSYNQEYKAG
jgi:hypothetical protein